MGFMVLDPNNDRAHQIDGASVLPENSNHTVSRRQPFVLMMQATYRQINPLHSNDIINPAFNSTSHMTDANIDASCNRTHHGSNVVISVGIPNSTTYN